MQKKINTKNNEIYLHSQLTRSSLTVINFRLAYNKNGYNKALKFNITILGLRLDLSVQVYKKSLTSQYCYAKRSM